MMQLLLIGIGAGAASALLFASVASGTVLSIVLFYVAALPILIATIGWSTLAGLIAAVVAAIGLGVVIDWRFFIAFALGVGAPAWWLGYLAMLARPADSRTNGNRRTGMVSGRTAGAVDRGARCARRRRRDPLFRVRPAEFRGRAACEFRAHVRAHGRPRTAPLQIPGVNDPQRFLDMLVAFMPMAAAVLGTVVLHVQSVAVGAHRADVGPAAAAVAGSAVDASFRRSPQALAALRSPAHSCPDIVGLIASIFAVALLIAYGALGLAVLHAITRGTARPPVDARRGLRADPVSGLADPDRQPAWA